MFEIEKSVVEEIIRKFLAEEGIEDPQLEFRQIPFSGEWGLAVPLFPVAAQVARSGKKVNVPQYAQELAEDIKAELSELLLDFSHIDAVKGYLNLYFSTSVYARRVVETILDQGPEYGQQNVDA
jgi:arginyl-tRNA synthetase